MCNVYKKIKHILYVLLVSVEGIAKVIVKAKGFKNCKIGDRNEIYILGNGPSLKKEFSTNKHFFKKVDCMCVNWFPLSDEFFYVKPKYLAMADPAFFSDCHVTMDLQDKHTRLFDILGEVDWDLVIVIPVYAVFDEWRMKKLAQNKHIKIMMINDEKFRGVNFIKQIFMDRKLTSFRFYNVLVMALTASLFMEYKKIFLLGCDHDWSKDLYVNHNNEVYIRWVHFYNDKEDKLMPLHKTPGTFFRMSELFMAFASDFEEYEKIEAYSKRKGSKIINTVDNSFIDAFERGGYGEDDEDNNKECSNG